MNYHNKFTFNCYKFHTHIHVCSTDHKIFILYYNTLYMRVLRYAYTRIIMYMHKIKIKAENGSNGRSSNSSKTKTSRFVQNPWPCASKNALRKIRYQCNNNNSNRSNARIYFKTNQNNFK